MKWWLWVVVLAVVLGVVLLCYRPDPDLAAAAEEEALFMVNPRVCNHDDPGTGLTEPGAGVTPGSGPAFLDRLPAGDADFLGPLYRPRLLIGPPDFAPEPRPGVILEQVSLQVDDENPSYPARITVTPGRDGGADADGGTAGADEQRQAPAGTEQVDRGELPGIRLTSDMVERLNALISIWRIVDVDLDRDGEGDGVTPGDDRPVRFAIDDRRIEGVVADALLDPATVSSLLYRDLRPVHVLIPSGGHMYAAVDPAELTPAPDDGGPVEGTLDLPAATGEGLTVAILDTSFHQAPPIGVHPTEQGHGAFVHGIIHEMLPEAEIVDVELGPSGQHLNVALGQGLSDLQQLYLRADGSDIAGLDELQALLIMLALQDPPPEAPDFGEIDAVNLSFGTYNCDGTDDMDTDLANPPRGLGPLMEVLGETPVFAAAGNDHSTTPFWPAAFAHDDLGKPWVFSVGALDEEGADWAGFSNQGPWVENCEVGEEVSARPVVSGAQMAEHISWSGTSFATPQALAFELAGEGTHSCPP